MRTPVDHAGMSVLTTQECLRALGSTPVGRVAFDAAGEVEVLPVNFALDGTSIVFRSAPGSKLTAAAEGAPLTFEADGFDATARGGWSVVVKGFAEVVGDDGLVARLESLGLRPWADKVARPTWVRLHPESITGRRVRHG